MQTPFHLEPAAPAAAYKTYALVRPQGTHVKTASCVDVDCPQYWHGWVTEVDETSTLGQMQAHYIRSESRRLFVEERTREGFTRFTFEAGQVCFAEHQVAVERDPVFIVRGGDWRGDPLGEPARRHTSAQDWVEDFAEHQQMIADARERG